LKPAFSSGKAFDGYGGLTRKQFYEKVSIGGERPPVSQKWPPLTRHIMKECWETDPSKRPTFERVAGIIRTDLEDMTRDESVLDRTKHMQRRSMVSRHGFLGSFERRTSTSAQNKVGIVDSFPKRNKLVEGLAA